MSWRSRSCVGIVLIVCIAIATGCSGESSPGASSAQEAEANGGESAAAQTPERANRPTGDTQSKTNERQGASISVEDYVSMAMKAASEAGIPAEDLVRYDEFAKEHPNHAHGIDVSHHQGDVEWTVVVETGIDFVYLKATEGIDYQDPLFQSNWQLAGKAGLPRGAYHMYRPEDTAYEQVRNFVETLKAAGIDDKMLPPVLDIERVRTVDSIPREQLHERATLWLRSVADELGVKPIVYTNPHFWRDYLRGDHELTRFSLWISEYDLDATAPESTGAWKQWTFWQFSRYGIVPGITKTVDLNRFFGEPAKLLSLDQNQ